MTHERHELAVRTPYRLDLTVRALRRLSTNVVDVLDQDGAYLRALAGARAPVLVRVVQTAREVLTVELEGSHGDFGHALQVVGRVLGVDRDLANFHRSARRIPWLAALADRMVGVKPPRYPTLWEACVNAIVFQQVSLFAASAIMGRMLLALASPLDYRGATLYPFPSVERFLETGDEMHRAAGLSANKLATLRRVGEALASGALDETMLEARSSPDAATLLQRIKGIGPWTATVILLRGLGRLDVFPMNDSSVARNIAFVTQARRFDVAATLQALGAQRGMLYFLLLLARLEARGELGQPGSVLSQ